MIDDDCQEDICATLKNNSREVDGLKKGIGRSASTARRIKDDTRALDQRYAILEPGDASQTNRLIEVSVNMIGMSKSKSKRSRELH